MISWIWRTRRLNGREDLSFSSLLSKLLFTYVSCLDQLGLTSPASFAFEWPVQQVIDLINRFKYSPAQCIVDGRPFVSTFEGPQWADNWPIVRQQTGGIFLVPDWASLGPHGVGQKLDYIDGACKFFLNPDLRCSERTNRC